jgi:hypothetical protein
MLLRIKSKTALWIAMLAGDEAVCILLLREPHLLSGTVSAGSRSVVVPHLARNLWMLKKF